MLWILTNILKLRVSDPLESWTLMSESDRLTKARMLHVPLLQSHTLRNVKFYNSKQLYIILLKVI